MNSQNISKCCQTLVFYYNILKILNLNVIIQLSIKIILKYGYISQILYYFEQLLIKNLWNISYYVDYLYEEKELKVMILLQFST